MTMVGTILFCTLFFPKRFGAEIVKSGLIAWHEGKRMYAEHAAKKGPP